MTKTSIGVQDLRTRIGAKAKAEPQHRFWGLYTHVWKLDVLREAYRLAKENDGAPGVDGATFAQVEAEGVEDLLEGLSRELREKTYRPLPSRHVNRQRAHGWCWRERSSVGMAFPRQRHGHQVLRVPHVDLEAHAPLGRP